MIKKILSIFIILLGCNGIVSTASANPFIPNNVDTKRAFVDEVFFEPNLELKRIANYYNQLRFYKKSLGKFEKLFSNTEYINRNDLLLISGRYKSLLVKNYDGQINLENFRLLQDIDPISKYKFDYKIINNSELRVVGFSQYGYLIFPLNILTEGINSIFRLINKFLSSSLGFSIIILALLVKVFLLPVGIKSVKANQNVTDLSFKINADISSIRLMYNGEKAHYKTLEVYKKYKVTPFYQLKPLIYLFIQIPILISVFNILGAYPELQSAKFFGINDLSLPDGSVSLTGFNSRVNILPIFLILFQLIITVLDHQKKHELKYYVISAFSFILFYDFPAALVLYWITTNILEFIIELGVKLNGLRHNT